MAAMLPEIIGLVGPIRAGKSTTAKYLVDRYDYTPASNSDVLKRILEGMGIMPSRANLASLGNSLFEVLGNDLIARHRLDNLHHGRIVVDGIRYPEEIERYSNIASFKLLAVTADPTVRFERALKSTEGIKDVNLSKNEFEQFAQSRSELSVPELMLKADATILNLGSVEDLRLRIDEVLSGWQT